MAETVALPAQKRDKSGTRHARRLREHGQLPAVVYGHGEETACITIPLEDFYQAIRHGSRLIDLQSDGGVQTALISEVQWDALGDQLLHVDFTRVSKDERVSVEVNLELKGTSPGAEAGGVLDQQMHSIEVECAAVDVPDAIIVNINELQLEEAIHVRDLHLPEGVTTGEDPDAVVIQVVSPVEEPEEEEEEGEGESAEPEVIKREKEEGEEEGD